MTLVVVAETPEYADRDLDGVSGDPSGSNVELGNIGMDFLVDAAMTQIRELLAE